MQPPDLAALEHANMIEAMSRFVSDVQGAHVRRADGVAHIASGIPFVLFNQVLVEDDGATAEGIADAVRMSRSRGDRFVVNLRVGTDDAFIGPVTELGLVPMSDSPWMPGMALHPPHGRPAPIEPGHEIRRVVDEVGIEDHIRTASAGFDLPEAILRSAVTPAWIASPGAALYVGYSDGQPVSTGFGLQTGRTIGVYTIATLPSFRRRGYGAAMTERVMADGFAAGCDVAILQASAMGQPVYERLGYRTVVEYMGYVEPASPDTGP
jgi:ribosomal protein S18 acetylase RimI-like enzyme